MRHSPTNNNNNRPNFNNNNRNNNQNKYRRPSSGTAQNRTDAIYDRDEMSDIVNPSQRRHASSQQTKFLDLAKNAKQIGDRVEMEYYMQHVEHYTRVLNLAEHQDNMRNQQRQPVRHAPPAQVSDNDNHGENDEETDLAPAHEETEEQRLARVERNRAKRRNRRLKRNNQTMQPQEQAEHVAALDDFETPNENTPPEQDNSSPQPAEIKPRSPRIKRVVRKPQSNDGQSDLLESNKGELLRDVLPAAKMDN
jgi:hypothetical protein